MHIHIGKAGAIGKIWLEPDVEISFMYGFSSREIKEILIIVNERFAFFKSKWNEYFKR